MVSNFDFESQLALHAKQDTIKLTFFIVFLEKCDFFFANDSKHRHIIYPWISFFSMSLDSRSLPQNKVLFGSGQLSKIHFAQKSVPMIRPFLS